MTVQQVPVRALTPKGRERPGALLDLTRGLSLWRLWVLLAWQDISLRYRRSILGPFWLTLSMGVMVGALGILYGGLFGLELSTYLPYLASGFVVWSFVSTAITDGCNAFLESEALIKQLKLPFSVYVFRIVSRNVIAFLHNLVIFATVAVIYDVWAGWHLLLALGGFLLLVLNAIWLGFFLGMISARFRDVPPITASVVQVVFFVTPILWHPDMLKGRKVFVDANLFHHLVEVVRAPLLGASPSLLSWSAVAGVTVIGWAMTMLMLRAFRKRISYWV